MAAATQSRRLIFWLVGAMLILSTALASAHSLPPHEKGVFPVAIQLYTLRNYGNIEQQLALAAAAGYQGVEFAGYHGLTAEEMKALLDKYNLLAISTHHGLTELESKLDDIIDYNLALGNTRIVVPSASANSGPEWRAIGERLNALGAKARERGVTIGFHNHAGEITQVYDGKMALEWLFEGTDPENVHVQIDLGWAYAGGADLVELIKKYEGRILSVHVKDMIGGRQANAIGEGEIDWATVLETTHTIGGTQWYIVEHDGPVDEEYFAYTSLANVAPLLAEITGIPAPPLPFRGIPIAVQQWTLRDLPFEEQFAVASAAGYAGIELYNTGGLSGEEMKALLDKYNLLAVSFHTNLNDLRNRLDWLIEFNKAIDNHRIVLPWADQGGDAAAWVALGEELNEIGAKLREHGMTLGYHNHAHEMVKLGDKTALEWLLDAAEPENLHLQLDIGWTVRGGGNAIALLTKYAGRTESVHVKDMALPGQNPEQDGWADVGLGVLPWQPVLEVARDAGVKWYIVEHDFPLDPAISIQNSYDYLYPLLEEIL